MSQLVFSLPKALLLRAMATIYVFIMIMQQWWESNSEVLTQSVLAGAGLAVRLCGSVHHTGLLVIAAAAGASTAVSAHAFTEVCVSQLSLTLQQGVWVTVWVPQHWISHRKLALQLHLPNHLLFSFICSGFNTNAHSPSNLFLLHHVKRNTPQIQKDASWKDLDICLAVPYSWFHFSSYYCKITWNLLPQWTIGWNSIITNMKISRNSWAKSQNFFKLSTHCEISLQQCKVFRYS